MPDFALNEDHLAIRETALAFARDRIAPHALEWDEKKYFPVDIIKESAALGFAGIYVREDVRRDGALALRRSARVRSAGHGLPRDFRLHLDP